MLTAFYSRNVIRPFLLIIIPILALLFITAAVHYYTNLDLSKEKSEADETLNINLAHVAIEDELIRVSTDLKFLSQLNELQAILQTQKNPPRKKLEHELLAFSRAKGIYDQIRYLDNKGNEIIRIDYNNGNPYAVSGERLKNKAKRYYFNETMALDAGQIYISPFDLNMEQGRIEIPYKPVIRFATPLFILPGQNRGILILNYLGDKLLQQFKQSAGNSANRIHLLNQEGFWLNSSPSGDTTEGMFDQQRSFAKRYPSAWQQINNKANGSFESETARFRYVSIYPAQIISNQRTIKYVWKIVILTPTILYTTNLWNFIEHHLSIYGILIPLLLIGTFIIVRINAKIHTIKTQRDYEHHFLDTFESAQLAAISLGRQGNVLLCNDYLLKQTGWSRTDLIGKNWLTEFVEKQDHFQIRDLLAKAAKTGIIPETNEMWVKTRNASPRLFAWNNTLSFDSKGNVSHITFIGKDITEQRRTEEQIHILSRAVDQSPNPVIITNINGIIEYVNPKFTQLTGYTAEEAIGHNPSILKSGETDSGEYNDLWEVISSGKEWRGLFHNRRKNGELYWEYTAISSIRNSEGEITHYLAIKEDITEQRRLEDEVKQRDRELAHAQALAVIGRMSSMIAHDLRNPLSSIKMSLQILGKRVDKADDQDWDAETRELGQIALNQVRYMENILADLLQFSRPEALNPEWLSIDKLLDIVVSSTEKTIKEHKAKIITEYQSQLPTVHGDATKLRQVFSNLILNALQATENNDRIPEIKIQTRMELLDSIPKIKVEFIDNGMGIDPDRVEKLFEPFYTSKAKGTGLGLSIVKRILDQHHGEIILSRNVDMGTCVTVILPTGPIH